LLDQLTLGELGFLQAKGKVPCWNSKVSMSAEELSDELQHWMIASISGALQELRQNLPAEPEAATKPKAVA
jgi:hypothetical protein